MVAGWRGGAVDGRGAEHQLAAVHLPGQPAQVLVQDRDAGRRPAKALENAWSWTKTRTQVIPALPFLAA